MRPPSSSSKIRLNTPDISFSPVKASAPPSSTTPKCNTLPAISRNADHSARPSSSAIPVGQVDLPQGVKSENIHIGLILSSFLDTPIAVITKSIVQDEGEEVRARGAKVLSTAESIVNAISAPDGLRSSYPSSIQEYSGIIINATSPGIDPVEGLPIHGDPPSPSTPTLPKILLSAEETKRMSERL